MNRIPRPTCESTALLISASGSLIQAVQGVVHTIPGLGFAVARLDEASSRLQGGGVALLLVHLTGGEATDEVAHILQSLRDARQPIATLVLSDLYQADQALALLRLGAADYLSRPLDLNRLAYLVDVLTARVRYTGATLAPAPGPADVQSVGERDPFLYLPSGQIALMMEQVRRVAPQNTTVLLGGETGTGKTRLARLIHELSPRRDEPFLVINCGALSATLIESEMFGHARGAFTGADRDRAGKFAEVGRGTLLLDEIDSLPLVLQAKLLRAVEERVFEPVGSNKSLPMQARLIVASNRALNQEVAAGRFRSDLYYRLNVVAFYLQPLRERAAVIQPMASKFLAEFATRNARDVRSIAPVAVRALEEYDWPGNIRELRNVIERAVALCPGPEIELGDLPEPIGAAVLAGAPAPADEPADQPEMTSTLSRAKEEAESVRIASALQKHRNNRLRAAAELGISRMTLYKKLHKYGLMSAC